MILPSERQAYLLHLKVDPDTFIVESYVPTQYESEHTSQDEEDFADLDLQLSSTVIENLPGLVIEFLEKMGFSEEEINNKLQGE